MPIKISTLKNSEVTPKKLYRLRTLLLLVTLSILLLPLASVLYFRFYENELVRQTEIELIAQSAVISATYRSFVRNQLNNKESYGIEVDSFLKNQRDDYYTPIFPRIDLSQQDVLPRRKNAKSVYDTPDLQAINAGNRLQQILQDSQQVTLSGMRVLDYRGTVIAGRNERGFSLAHINEVKQALQGKYTSVIRQRLSDEAPPPIASISRGTGIRVFTAFPIIEGDRLYGVVYLSRTPQNILKHLYAVTGRVLIAALIVLVVTLLLAFFVSSRIVRPIKQLTSQAQKLANGDIITIDKLEKPGTYEVNKLSQSFSTMSQTLQQRGDYIRQFATHVSHEFKTPLTSIQGAIELLQDHMDDMPATQRQKFLDNLQTDTRRLEKLVSRLLELAKADAMQLSNENSDLYLCLDILKTRYHEKGLDILITPNHSSYTVAIASDVLETVFTNLLENSLQHQADHISINIVQHDKSLEISLQDNGSGISPANAERIFTPFFTTRRNQGGTGLGLDIVASLLQTWNGDIHLKEVSEGAAFMITILLITQTS
ncbi:MAG TPA: HAMP domain-containing histidine kinase [Leucothrix mucor]|nr:HAMP domain-containing histidine kinase [Leucothrix mucor]